LQPIDFNAVSSYNSYSSNSENLVKIHQRSPPSHASPFFSDAENRRKRFKVVPNTQQPFKVTSNIQEPPKVVPPVVEPTIPEDRVELIKLLKSQISRELYTLFLRTLKSYQQTQNFDDMMVNLIQCFSTKKLNYILRGMRRFVKEHHHKLFDQQVAEYRPVD
jgi:deoxyribodipyrimidine photolyase